MQRTKLFPFGLIMSSVMLFAACGSGGGGTKGGAESEDIEINVAVWSDWGFIERAAQDYMDTHPNVTIRVDAIPGVEYFQNLPRTIGTPDAPDISVVQVFSVADSPYQNIIASDDLVELSSIWDDADLENNMTPSTVENYTQDDGSRYAVDIGPTFGPVTFYNKDLFEELGIDVTDGGRIDSNAALLEISDTLSDAGLTPMTSPWDDEGHHKIQQMLVSSCGQEVYGEFATAWQDSGSAVDWTDSCVVNAIESLKEPVDKGLFGDNPILNRDVAMGAFLSQETGMLTSGSYLITNLTEQAEFDIGWFMPPPANGGDPTNWMLFTVDGLAINANSPHVEVAQDFLSTVVTQEFQSSMLSDGRPPSRTDVVVPEDADPMLPEMMDSFDTYGTVGHIVEMQTPVEYRTIMVEGMQEVLLGSLSPEELAQQLETLTSELRDKNE